MEIFLNKIQFRQTDECHPSQLEVYAEELEINTCFMHFHPEYILSEVRCYKSNHKDLSLLLLAPPGKINFTSGGSSAARGWGRQTVLHSRSCHHGQHSDYELLRDILQAFL